MALQPGAKLGPYEILSPIGAGGMGEVYKARDPRLDRIVAIKTSKQEFSERFEREARAIAALNHPNICTLFDVGPNYLVMEFVEGTPLKGPLPVEQALEYASQIASALDAAHTKGITHRDLKPANILATKQGIKLLDFGLARLEKAVPVEAETLTMGLTLQGQILGTLQYMSPEQANGHEADARSDIFSFGLVLYEMLTGKRAFDGATPASVIAAIIERPAPSVADVAPAAVNRVLKRCLEKSADDRWQSARDLRAALELISASDPTLPAALSLRGSRTLMPWAVAALAIMAASGLAAIHFSEQPAEPEELRRFEVLAPKDQTLFGFFELSPDGRNLAYVAQDAKGVGHLWVRPMNVTEARQVADIDGAFAWSPDSRSIAGMAPGGKLLRVDITGGAPQVISTPGHVIQVAWGRQDVVLLSAPLGLYSVPAIGGAPKLVDPKGHAASNPAFLPDGGHFLHNNIAGGLDVVSLNAGESVKRLLKVPQTNVSFIPVGGPQTGHLLYMQGTALMARPFNAATLEFRGEEATLVNGVARAGSGIGFFSVAEDGTLAYRAGNGVRVATLFDRSGKVLGVFPGTSGLSLSPDGTRFTAQMQGAIWIVDMQKNTTQRFSAGGSNAVWSPDGQQIVFGKGKDLFIKPSNGARDEQLLFQSPENKEATDWSRDGRYILFVSKGDLWYFDRTTGKASPYVESPKGQERGQFSPDGKFVAYQSEESGQPEIYVRTFPAAEGRWLISRGGGFTPRWRPDGKELFYRSEQTLYRSVDVKLGAGLEIGQQHDWFNAEGAGADYDVMPDGNRFLVRTLAPETLSAPITVVLNWQALLKK